MSAFLAPALLALAVLAFPAAAGDPSGGEPPPIKPATGHVKPASAGDRVKPASAGDRVKPASAGDSSRGGSAQPTGPQDADLERSRAEDERRATESKEKMKTRPGYKENVPSPRA